MKQHALNLLGEKYQPPYNKDVECVCVGSQGRQCGGQHEPLLRVIFLGYPRKISLKFHLSGAETYAHSCISGVLKLQFQVHDGENAAALIVEVMEVSVRFFVVDPGSRANSRLQDGPVSQQNSHGQLRGKPTTSHQNTSYQSLASLSCNKFPKPL